MTQKVSIEMTNHGRGKIFIDGQELRNVKSFVFTGGVHEMNSVTVTFLPTEVSIEAAEAFIGGNS